MPDSSNIPPVVNDDDNHLELVFSYFEIKQKDAAKAIGVDASNITHWKKGDTALGVDSPSMGPLVDFILNRNLTEGDLEWLKRRFASAGLNHRVRSIDELRFALMNYLANDGSRIGPESRRSIYNQEHFTLCGLDDIVLFLQDELSRCPKRQSVILTCSNKGIETESPFHEIIEDAVFSGIHLKMLFGEEDNNADDLSVMQRYLIQIVHPTTTAKCASKSFEPFLPCGMATTLLIANRLCIHISGKTKSAPYIACCIRQRDYVRQVGVCLTQAMSAGIPLAEVPQADITPRLISSKMLSFYHGTGSVLVVSDGLNPLFMSEDAFERFLLAKGYDEYECAWRVEAFHKEQKALEKKMRKGGVYHEMTTALDAPCVRDEGKVATNGPTFYDSQFSDLETTLEILRGYLRFASLYEGFGVRFTNPSEAMSYGLWMIAPGDTDESAAQGLIVCRRVENGQHLYFENKRLVSATTSLFEDAWANIRYRFSIDGHVVSNEDEGESSDYSRNVYFIRERIKQLEQIISDRTREA